MPPKLTLFDLLRASQVQRWHILNTSRQQNMAEHSYMVAVISLALHHFIHRPSPFELNEAEVMQLVVGALFHDSPEIRTGDIPTPGKELIEKHAPVLMKEIDRALMPELPFVGGNVPEGLRRIIKMADIIEAAHWIRNNGAGDFAEQVAEKCYRKVEDAVHNYGAAEWKDPVNKILDALGMPRFPDETP